MGGTSGWGFSLESPFFVRWDNEAVMGHASKEKWYISKGYFYYYYLLSMIHSHFQPTKQKTIVPNMKRKIKEVYSLILSPNEVYLGSLTKCTQLNYTRFCGIWLLLNSKSCRDCITILMTSFDICQSFWLFLPLRSSTSTRQTSWPCFCGNIE